MKHLLLSLSLFLLCLTAGAEDFTYEYEGQTLTYTIIDESTRTCRLKAGDGTPGIMSPGNNVSGDLIIPFEAGDFRHKYKVIEISGCAFCGCNRLTSVTIPNSVTTIGRDAFYCCRGLTSVTIPNSVTSIGWNAFSDCSGLTSVTIPNGVTSIDGAAFSDCSGLTSVTIPNGVTSIGDYTFEGCSGLTSVTIPNSVTSIGGSAFNGCSGLTSVTIPDGVTSIGDWAFRGCSSLTSVTIPNGVTSIGDYTFEGCSGLTSMTIPNSVTSIGEHAFQGCGGLTSVSISNSITSIGKYAFYGCSGLTEIYIHNLTPPSADRSSFDEQNYKNATLYVPEEAYNTYDNMGNGPWKYFMILQRFKTPTFFFDYDENNMTATITGVNKGKVTSKFVIPDATTHNDKTYTVVAIGEEVFKDCSSMTSVLIPNSVTSIGGHAFQGCSGLTSLTIPNSVTSIGDYAFYGCSGLTEVYSLDLTPPDAKYNSFDYDTRRNATLNVPKEALEAYKNAEGWMDFRYRKGFDPSILYDFNYDDYNMTATIIGVNKNILSPELVIPETTTYNGKTYTVVAIGEEVFEGCSGLTSVTIPKSVTDIGNVAFRDCSSLTKVYISDLTAWCNIKFGFQYSNPLQYAHHLYLNEEEITNLIIPEGIKAIGDCAFRGYSGLTSVTIPKSVTNIGSVAFSDCSSLTEVYISDLTAWCNIKFGSHVFTMPHHLYLKGEDVKHLVIPDGITSINDFAFQGCSGLTSVTIPNSVTSIGEYVFYGCSGLTSVNIPNSVTSIGYSAFERCSGLTSVTIPNSVTTINDFAFEGCSGLTSVTIPNSVTSINDCAFFGCSSLTSVTIPNSVTSIDEWTFNDCNSLTEVYSLNLTPPSTNTTYSPFDDRIYQEATLYVPNEALDAYRNAEGWKEFQNIKGFDPTGIQGIEVDESRGQDVYYDLNGRRLSTPRKGLNIINGKKVIIK